MAGKRGILVLVAFLSTLATFLTRPVDALPVRRDDCGPSLPKLTIVETLLFTSSGPMTIDFQDAFCNGSSFTVFDNGVNLGTTISPLPRFCGLAVSSYRPIVFPTFSDADYLFTAGFHNVTVVVTDSPLANGATALRITFHPAPGVKYSLHSQVRESFPQPRRCPPTA